MLLSALIASLASAQAPAGDFCEVVGVASTPRVACFRLSWDGKTPSLEGQAFSWSRTTDGERRTPDLARWTLLSVIAQTPSTLAYRYEATFRTGRTLEGESRLTLPATGALAEGWYRGKTDAEETPFVVVRLGDLEDCLGIRPAEDLSARRRAVAAAEATDLRRCTREP